MIIRLYGTNYRIDQNLAMSAKTTIRKILESVRVQSKLRGIEKYYTAFVVMMYVTSSSILRELNADRIKEIVSEIKAEEEKGNGESAFVLDSALEDGTELTL